MADFRWLRLLAVAEAMTLLLLVCVAVPLKRIWGLPEFVSVMGPVHGFAFISFAWVVAQHLGQGTISRNIAIRLLIGACIPFGGLVNERWLKRQRQIA